MALHSDRFTQYMAAKKLKSDGYRSRFHCWSYSNRKGFGEAIYRPTSSAVCFPVTVWEVAYTQRLAVKLAAEIAVFLQNERLFSFHVGMGILVRWLCRWPIYFGFHGAESCSPQNCSSNIRCNFLPGSRCILSCDLTVLTQFPWLWETSRQCWQHDRSIVVLTNRAERMSVISGGLWLLQVGRVHVQSLNVRNVKCRKCRTPYPNCVLKDLHVGATIAR